MQVHQKKLHLIVKGQPWTDKQEIHKGIPSAQVYSHDLNIIIFLISQLSSLPACCDSPGVVWTVLTRSSAAVSLE